jgi:hypothetical protein
MSERGISEVEIRQVLETGETVEDYPQGLPYPSRLLLGWVESRPIHVVAAENEADGETIVVTVYEPDPNRWEDEFRRRKMS